MSVRLRPLFLCCCLKLTVDFYRRVLFCLSLAQGPDSCSDKEQSAQAEYFVLDTCTPRTPPLWTPTIQKLLDAAKSSH